MPHIRNNPTLGADTDWAKNITRLRRKNVLLKARALQNAFFASANFLGRFNRVAVGR